MRLQGEHVFDASRETVWKALNDPRILSRTLPGCDHLDEREPNVYTGALNIKVGPVTGKFQGTVRLHDLEENRGYRLELDGQGAPGFVQGKGAVTLADREDGGTVLAYDLDAQVGGRIAGVGQRLLDSSAKVVTRQALEGLAVQVEALASAPVHEAPVHEAATPGAAKPGVETPGSATPGAAAAEGSMHASPRAPSPGLFAVRVARGVFEDLVPAPWRPAVIGVVVLMVLAAVVLTVRACAGA